MYSVHKAGGWSGGWTRDSKACTSDNNNSNLSRNIYTLRATFPFPVLNLLSENIFRQNSIVCKFGRQMGSVGI
jgi:hypothetical protein